MIKENVKIMNWRNGFLLSLVSYILYLIIWLILDDETANQLPGMATVGKSSVSCPLKPSDSAPLC